MTDTHVMASDIINRLSERFASGNSVPVERIHLTRDEFHVLLDQAAIIYEFQQGSRLGDAIQKALTALQEAPRG